MGAPYQGYANLGEAIFGRGNRQDAYNRGATEAAQLELLLAKARQEVDQARKRSEYRQTLIQNGVPAEVASILDAAQGSGYNPEQISGYRLGTQRFDLTGEAAGMARSGNVDAMNNLLTVINGSPRVRTNITQGMAFDPYAAPQQQMQTTPVGLADIAMRAAQGRNYDASAAESYADADLRNRTNPNIRVGSSGRGQPPVLLQGPPPPNYAPKPGEVSLESILRAEGLTPDQIAQAVRAEESGQGFSVTIPPTRPPMRAGAGAQVQTAPAQQAPRPTEQEAVQALADAREAIRRGLITPEEAKRRLRAAGMTRTAERIK